MKTVIKVWKRNQKSSAASFLSERSFIFYVFEMAASPYGQKRSVRIVGSFSSALDLVSSCEIS